MATSSITHNFVISDYSGLSEPPVRTLRATIPGNESQLKFLILDDYNICQNRTCKGC